MSARTPSEISDSQIRTALSPFSISLSDGQIAQIRVYIGLLLRWNRSVSLTSLTNPVEIVGRHFGESLYATKILPVENCRLADVGTGAGFPGLALKIVCPGIHLTLIESNKKKCAFLAEVVRTLSFSDVEIHSERFEQVRPETIRGNIITSRAVGDYVHLLHWSANALVHRGHIMLWVGGEESIRIASNSAWIWQPAVRLPESQRRLILVGRPMVESSTYL